MKLFHIMILVSSCSLCLEAQQERAPSTPYVEKNVCPFEYGCIFHKWYSRAPIRAYTTEGDTNSPSFLIAASESLQYNFGNMHVERVGIVIVRKAFQGYRVGDSVFVLSYRGEGSFSVWHHGAFDVVTRFWDSDTNRSLSDGFEALEVSMSWWVNVTDAGARSFWLKLHNTEGSKGISFAEDIEIKQIGFEQY
jgi:hypothetical protein